MRISTTLLALVMALACSAAQAQAFRWVDKDGKVRYGDSPPPGVKATAMKMPGTAAPGPAPAATPGPAAKDGKVLLLVNGKAVERKLKLGPTSSQGVRVEEGLIGGEDIILNPPAEVKNGANVERKK